MDELIEDFEKAQDQLIKEFHALMKNKDLSLEKKYTVFEKVSRLELPQLTSRWLPREEMLQERCTTTKFDRYETFSADRLFHEGYGSNEDLSDQEREILKAKVMESGFTHFTFDW